MTGLASDRLLAAARAAGATAYAPYSGLAVGAALLFADGVIVTGANVENASYGLSLCAETVAVAKALGEGRRAGLVAVAIAAEGGAAAASITPCGRCRQVLHELAMLDSADPLVLCARPQGHAEGRLSELLPGAFALPPGQPAG